MGVVQAGFRDLKGKFTGSFRSAGIPLAAALFSFIWALKSARSWSCLEATTYQMSVHIALAYAHSPWDVVSRDLHFCISQALQSRETLLSMEMKFIPSHPGFPGLVVLHGGVTIAAARAKEA